MGRPTACGPAAPPLLHGHRRGPGRVSRGGRRALGSPGGMGTAGPACRGGSMNTVTGATPGDDEYLYASTLIAARNDELYFGHVWQDAPSYGFGVPKVTVCWIDSTGRLKSENVSAPDMARIAAANPIREDPPVWNKGADTASTPSREDSAQADAYTDVLAGHWSQAGFSLGQRRRWARLRGAEAPGRHRREREVVLSPRLLTGAAVFLAGQKRSSPTVHLRHRALC